MGDIGQIAFQNLDLRDPDTIYESIRHSNLVINLIAQKADSRNFTMESVNVDGSRLIAKICREARVERLIHVSTSLYNSNSLSEWARTKSDGEKAVLEVFPKATILRPTVFFGSEDTFLSRPSQIIRWSSIYPILRPKRKLQPVHVDDVARAILEASANPNTVGKIYELGGPNILTQGELIEFLKKILYLNRPVVEIPDWIALKYAKLLYKYHRNPRMVPDDIEQSKYDLVTNPEALSFPDLGIETDELLSIQKSALGIVRVYRNPLYFENTNDDWQHPPKYKPSDDSDYHVRFRKE